MSLEVALLDASSDDLHSRENFERTVPAQVTSFDVTTSTFPPDPGEGFDAAIISGSAASVYWDLDWIDPLTEWVAAAIDRGTPVLGVCFGFQLLADVLGGEVESCDAYELGFHTVEHAGDSMLFDGLDREFMAFTSHSDDVVAVPPGARRLAENRYSAHAFRRGHVFGVQFHPEVDRETAIALVEERDPDDERCPDAAETVTESNFEAATETRIVFENFLDYVRRR